MLGSQAPACGVACSNSFIIHGTILADAPVQRVSSDKAFIQAVNQGDAQRVYSLVKHGVNVNTIDPDGQPTLILAAENGDDKIVTFLLDHGAKVDTKASKRLLR